jgi:CubicO group peptidase (beta-lactamase class C family)
MPRPRRIAGRLAALLVVATSIPGCAATASRDTSASPASRAAALPSPSPTAKDAAIASPPLIDDELPAGSWPATTPAAAGLDPHVIDGLVREAEATGPDALLVVVDGHTVVERYFGEPRTPIETMSVTKSVVALAIGMLIEDGRIASIDAPLSTWLPEWKKGRKAKVTLRHVLTHTSGLAHHQGAEVELNRQSDRTAFVRKSAIVDEPGKVFSYNNEAVQLLDAVVRKAAGTSLDRYLDERLFAPLGITEWSWERDPAGNVQAFYGLALHARDLAKIGMLMLDRGKLGDRVLVPETFVTQATTEQAPRSSCGWLWWIRPAVTTLALRTSDVDKLVRHGAARAGALDDLVGQRHASAAALWLALAERTDEAGRTALVRLAATGLQPFAAHPGETLGFAADGWLGQHLIVIPEHRLVAVRQHRAPTDAMPDDAYNTAHGFFGLVRWLDLAIVRDRGSIAAD